MILSNIHLFLDSIEQYKTEEDINDPAAEKDLRKKFEVFLSACHFYPTLHDFKNLIKFKSGDNRYRSDGTINWYHEFIPIVNELALIRAGKDAGGVSLDNLEEEGGLGVKISTIINHDRIEDTPTSERHFAKSQRRMVHDLAEPLAASLPYFYTPERKKWDLDNARKISRNVWLMTKKVIVLDEKGKPILTDQGKLQYKELFHDTKAFFNNLVVGKQANPTSFTGKQADASINIATLTGSKKHTVQKKKDFCNAYEDLCGSRTANVEDALDKWPTHANAINYWDNTMGFVLYLEFAWLEYVDYAYEGEKNKYQRGDSLDHIRKSGIRKYLDVALSIPKPRFASAIHTALDRKRKQAEHDPQALECLKRSIYPALQKHTQYFPEIFDTPTTQLHQQSMPSPKNL